MKFYSIIFDWKQTLYDPATNSLIDGAHEVLSYLKERHNDLPLYLVGKGDQAMYKAARDLGIEQYFSEIVFIGSKKEPIHFLKYMDKENPKKTIIVGDKPSSEISVGNLVGATTIRVRQGKFKNDEPQSEDQEPDMEVKNLRRIIPVLRELLS